MTRMSRIQQALRVAAALSLISGIAAAAAVHDQPWPDSQEGLGLEADGFDSYASMHATLPANLVVTPPPAKAPQALKDYAGKWSGWMCKGRSTDLKVALTKVAPKAATATVAWAESDTARGSATLQLIRVGDEFRSTGGAVLYKFHLRPVDDVRVGVPVMDVMRIRGDGSSCNGILRRDSAS